MGHEVHIITSNFPKSEEQEIMDGITIERHKCLARPFRNPITPTFLTLGKKIKKFDVVHTHNEHSFAAMVAAYLRRKTDVPLILTCHGQLRFGNFFVDAFERTYSKSIGRMIFEISDHIVTLSASDKQYVSSLGIDSKKISIITNAIEPSELEKFYSGDLESFRRKCNLDEKRVVLFVGPVIKRKGVEYLIRAIPIVLRNITEISFVFTGGGDFLDDAKLLSRKLGISGNVIFTGLIGMRELIKFYRISDLFVLPSFSEGMPTSILEAMYFGLPVVTTDIPGVRDHFSDVALLVPPKNENRLAEAIVRLLDDEKLRKKLSEAGKELVKHKYTWDVVAKKYEQIYKSTLECTTWKK